jgi:translation initiation factor IF-2
LDKKKTKTRIYDIAKEYKISSDALLKVLRGLGFTIKSHMSVASEDMLEAIAEKFKREIEEVKKSDEARKQRRQELAAKQRREEAEKAALRRKAETLAKKKKALAETKAKQRAAKELDKAETLARKAAAKKAVTRKEEPKAKPTPAETPRKATKPKAKPKPAVSPTAKAKDKRVVEKSRKAHEKITEAPSRAAAPTRPGKPKRPVKKPSKPEKKPIAAKGGVTVSPEAAKKIEKKLKQNAATTKSDKKRRKRDRSKKGRAAHKVDKAAVKLTFKKTMANIEGPKKAKKYKKRSGQDDGIVDDGIPTIEVTEFMTLSELAKLFEKKPAELIAKCMELGMLASINQRLDMDTIETLALEFEFNVKVVEEPAELIMEQEEEVDLRPRYPVVTIMGHVDHGKTTLLDYIRESNIVSGEAGKITQHIGAYTVHSKGGTIAFLDTPGHEAFSAMRARGAQVTDIVILVVSATEAVMPQTLEAIDHARAAGVPMIVAINKMDLPNANPDAVRQQLANHNILDESWGGKVIMVEISSKSGLGVDKLLEMILLQAEIMELKADPDIKAQGAVIEARLEKGRGTVATVLVQKGTLRIGNPFVAGNFYGRVRAMLDDRGGELTEAGPSRPVQVIGISGVPLAGDSFMATEGEAEARSIALKRQQIKREYEIRRVGTPTTLESVYEKIKDGQITDLEIIIKGDVAGSVEALTETLSSIGNEEVRVSIIRSGVGAITESDVLLAAASNAIIVGFHVTADLRAREMAIREKVDIRTYSIIYEVQEDITKAIEGLLKPEVVEKWVGTAEVRQTFKVPKIGVISGTYVQQGRFHRGDRIRLSRDGVVIHEGMISSLKRFKEDVREVTAGLECGIGIERYDDIKVGDMIEAYELVETERKLTG